MKKNKLIIILLISLLILSCKSADSLNKKDNFNIQKLKSKKLNIGATIGLVSPASLIKEKHLHESIRNLEALGFKVKYNNEIKSKYGYLAGPDSLRAADLNQMFADDEIDAICAVRGGYGCARMLDLIDYELIKNNPKIIIGYSDITSLLYAIYKKTSLVCFHGPVGTSTFNEYSVEHLKNILVTPKENYKMANLPEDRNNIVTINPGKAKGELIGGNLSIVVSMIGTEYDIDSKDKIIFLEDIGEEPYRIDRMLTQMKLAGKFDNCSGVALGVFKNCEIDKDDPEFEESLTLLKIFKDIFGDLEIPVVYGLSFGHIENKFTLPFGVEAKLDADKGSITLLEKAVR
ncbi:MAG: LD-carboxypeptidase [Ignavibacteriae bacterium]|nr:MAG: LD-carboxypeptidase [Ignavibacteriota bacterium]